MLEVKNNCLFCQIKERHLKSHILYENQDCIAILDIFPASKGHILLISKRCVPNILFLKEKELTNINLVAKKMIEILINKFEPKGFNLVNNFNKIAGQMINHYHLHIIPKYVENEGWFGSVNKPYTTKNLEQIAKELKK